MKFKNVVLFFKIKELERKINTCAYKMKKMKEKMNDYLQELGKTSSWEAKREIFLKKRIHWKEAMHFRKVVTINDYRFMTYCCF